MPRTLCVLLWAQPGAQAALTAYEDRVLRLVPDHGGRVLQRGRGGGAGGQPAEIQFRTLATEWAYQPDGKTVRLKLRSPFCCQTARWGTAHGVWFHTEESSFSAVWAGLGPHANGQ